MINILVKTRKIIEMLKKKKLKKKKKVKKQKKLKNIKLNNQRNLLKKNL